MFGVELRASRNCSSCISLADLLGIGVEGGKLKDPGAMGLTDLDRMRSARPRGIGGTWRFLRASRADARSSRGVDIGRETDLGGLDVA